MNIERFASPLPAPLSTAVRAGDFVFLSGVVAMDDRGEIVGATVGEQTRFALGRVGEALGRCGASLVDVVRTTVWLADLAGFAEFNAEYARHFSGALPCRSTTQAVLHKGALVEIEATAFVPVRSASRSIPST